jgi:hypothetical protein
MPQIPIIIPVIVAGLAVGSVIRSENPRISRRKLLSASGAAGLLNAVYGYFVYLFSPEQPSFRGTFSIPTTAEVSFVPTTPEVPFVIASFLTGCLIVLVVLGIAMVYARGGKEGEPAEITEATSEQEPTPFK